MNNEPVAWMLADKEAEHIRSIMAVQHDFVPEGCVEIPLYTHSVEEQDEQFKKGFEAGKEEGWKAHKFHHPVEEQNESFDRTASHMAGEYVAYQKELTDEEIISEWVGCERNYYNFARAILRKAQK